MSGSINSLKRLLQKNKRLDIYAQGVSMLPLFRKSDRLVVEKFSTRKLKVNDIIFAYKNNNLFTHRVIYKDLKSVITKGDNNILSDKKILLRNIIGKIIKIKKNGEILNLDSLYLFQSTYYFQEIVKIKRALDKDNINFVFLKGLPLHLYFEKTHPKRIYADCDILIDKNYTDKVKAILLRFKYKLVKTEYSFFHKLLKDKKTEDVFVKRINNFLVFFDIHYEISFLMNQLGKLDSLYPQVLIDKMTKLFLKKKKNVNIQGEYFPILSESNLIIYLSLHFFHHNFRGIHLLDLMNKIILKYFKKQHVKIFQELVQTIENHQLQNFVYPVFLLLKKYYKLYLPKTFYESIKPNRRKLEYIKKSILNINVFDSEPRIIAGINRFNNIFNLSPNPLYQKLLVFIQPAVIYSFIWVIIFFLSKSFIKFVTCFRAISCRIEYFFTR